MISTTLYVLLLMQAPGSFQSQRQVNDESRYFQPTIPAEALMPAAGDPDNARQKAAEQRRFVASFNQLVESMRSFAETYNAGRIDVKKVKALKRAWRELESSEPWFKPDRK